MKRKQRLRKNHFDMKHERRNATGCPICDDRKREDLEGKGVAEAMKSKKIKPSFIVSCSMCSDELKQPGALLISPPHTMASVAGELLCWKSHICLKCWDKLREWAFPEEEE